MFDLPVTDKPASKEAAKFRKFLLDRGFAMAQYSVYSRFCGRQGMAKTLTNQIAANLPSRGIVQVLQITDKQYEKIQTFFGEVKQTAQKNPNQYRMF